MSDHKPTCATVLFEKQDNLIQASRHEDVQGYRATWPKHCADCGGWGKVAGKAERLETGEELCDACLAGEICPRCAREPLVTHEDSGPAGDRYSCVGCGWTEDRTKGLPDAPELAECDCWSLDDL